MKIVILMAVLLICDFLAVESQEMRLVQPSIDSTILWVIPADGGTPKDLTRIAKKAPDRFHIRASFEEGGESVLKHAVSRMDLICNNKGTKPVMLTLEIDLSQDGKRTDYDNRPEAGMKWRDFIFIRFGHQSWKQASGKTEGWLSIVRFEVPPGMTEIGLSPWYTYKDYTSFIESLKEGPFLKKTIVGKTNGGRDHWELTITDTTINAQKKETIFWQAREHAYESFSSFAMEGLIPFLLSDKAKEFRKRYVIILHPMTNIDGVAEGYEYRAGYDFPEPRTSESGKMTFDAVDRLRPDYAVAWHNWISPRDRNVVFYTDGANGKATARAWLRFSQLFPSLRAWEHRWKDEATPMKYNWHDKKLGDNNIHQYAMKHYGTKIWGWEMPWWNFTTDDARNAGAAFSQSFLTTISEISSNSMPAPVKKELIRCPRSKMTEFNVKAAANVSNPYQDAMLVGEFISPTGKSHIMDGFYDGNGIWKLRFVPDEEGTWTYRLRGEGVNILEEGDLLCTASEEHGFIRIHPESPYGFSYADSLPFFPMGDTNYGLYDDSPITAAGRQAYLTKRRQQGFNFVRMEVGHSHEHANVNPAYWAWGGTASKPDLDQYNPVFFKGLDTLLAQMQRQGMNAELILLNYYRLPFTDTTLWTVKRERRWIRYLLSRYSAFSNIFMWTISNEYETHPDGKYRIDTVTDPMWVRETAQFIQQNDPYHHLVTVHPVVSSSTKGNSPVSPIALPWRIGGFYGADSALSVLSQQTGQTGEGVVWDTSCLCWNGDDPQLMASIRADRVYKKPVINTENGYEYLHGLPTMRNQTHHTAKVRRTSWRIISAGGYFSAGFSGTLGHSDIWNRIDSPNHYTFSLQDEGAGAQLGYLYKFYTALPFWRMNPYTAIHGDAVALADSITNIFVLYFPHGGNASLEWTGNEILEGRWFNPRTGRFGLRQVIKPAAMLDFDTPDKQDWVLLLQPKAYQPDTPTSAPKKDVKR